MCFDEHVLFQRGYFRLGQSHLFSSKMPVNYHGLASFLLIRFILLLEKLQKVFFQWNSGSIISGTNQWTIQANALRNSFSLKQTFIWCHSLKKSVQIWQKKTTIVMPLVSLVWTWILKLGVCILRLLQAYSL